MGTHGPESLILEQCLEDLWKLIHFIRYKYNNPSLFLMGHSWGGTLGAAFLLQIAGQQYISGWIDVSGEMDWANGLNLSVEWTKKRAEEKTNVFSYMKTPVSLSFLFHNLNALNNYNVPATLNMFPKLHKILIPTLIMAGRHDGIIPVESAQTAFYNIGSGNKYLHIFENCAHFPHIEEQELFVQKVKKFVEKYR